jgi:flagellar basal body-associated protein FliL
MSTLEIILLAVIMTTILTAIAGYFYYLQRKLKLNKAVPPAATIAAGVRMCSICGTALPKTAVRTHEGKWRCAEHKLLRFPQESNK